MNDVQNPVPGGATAICAGVLATLGSLAHLLGGACAIAVALTPPRVNCYAPPCPQPAYLPHLGVFGGIGLLLLGIGGLLGAGAFGLFRRRPKGRTQVMVACVLVVVGHLAGLAIVAIFIATGDITDTDAVDFSVTMAIAQVFPVVTLVLAAVPATRRYSAHTPRSEYGSETGEHRPGPGGRLESESE